MKTDNARGAKSAKADMRRNVLAAVRPAKVFDAFSGLGGMYEAVWHQADEYLGCDSRQWSLTEPHRRMVCDNRLALRCVELQSFNVFDFDAYGQPWEQMLILAHRRKWAAGERGAVVLTDGTAMKTRFGSTSWAMAQLLGTTGKNLPRSDKTADAIQRVLLTRWCSLAGVKPLRCWRSSGRGSGRGGQRMIYTALVFEGLPN